MRTLEEIMQDIKQALSIYDPVPLRSLADEALAVGSKEAHAAAQNALGAWCLLSGDYDQAIEHFKHELSIHTELKNITGVANATGNLGNVFDALGDYRTSLEYYESAVALYEELGDQRRMAIITGSIGSVFNKTGDLSGALQNYERAIAIHEDRGDRDGVATITVNMGTMYYHGGDYPRALEHFERALAVTQELGNRLSSAMITSNIGTVYSNTGDYGKAIERLERALAVEEELGNRAGIATALSGIGSVYMSTNETDRALEYFERAALLYEELGDLAGMARSAGNLIDLHLAQGAHIKASELLTAQASMMLDEPEIYAWHLVNRAALAQHEGNLDLAHTELLAALKISEETGIRHLTSDIQMRLRDLARKRHDLEGYVLHNDEYHRINEEVNGKQATQKMVMMEAERKMQAERAEREKERTLLYGTLPKHVADRILSGEVVSGDHFDHASVLFTDIVGFTSNSSSMPPSEVVHLLENVFNTFDTLCDLHGVAKIKTIGDSYMCFKGDGEDAENASSIAQLALDMQRSTFSWPSGEPLVMRIGIHIGPATAGVIGTQRVQYDVWGDTVNIASRMESTSEPGRIHMSEVFANVLRSITNAAGVATSEAKELVVTQRGTVDIKGKGAMKTFWLEGA